MGGDTLLSVHRGEWLRATSQLPSHHSRYLKADWEQGDAGTAPARRHTALRSHRTDAHLVGSDFVLGGVNTQGQQSPEAQSPHRNHSRAAHPEAVSERGPLRCQQGVRGWGAGHGRRETGRSHTPQGL